MQFSVVEIRFIMFTPNLRGGTLTRFTRCCDFVSLYSDHLYLSTRIRYATVIFVFPFSEASAEGKYLKGTSLWGFRPSKT